MVHEKNLSNLTSNRFLEGPTYYKYSWILAQVVSAIILIFSIWITFSLIISGRKSKKWRLRNMDKASILRTIGVFCPITLFIRTLTTQALVLIEKFEPNNEKGDRMCEMVIDASLFLFAVVIFPTYVFLWYRQRMLYSRPTLQSMNNKFVQFFSFLFVICLVLGGGSSAFLVTIPKSFQMSNFGCVYLAIQPVDRKANIVTAATLVFSQVILLGLFCYPFIRHRKESKNLTNTSRNAKPDKAMFKAIRSATISTTICVISDIVSIILVSILGNRGAPLTLTRPIYDISLFINVISVLFCFDKFKTIFFGFCNSNVENNPSNNLQSVRSVNTTTSC